MTIAMAVYAMFMRRRIMCIKIIVLVQFEVHRSARMLLMRVAQGFRTGRQCQKGECRQQGHQPLQKEARNLHHTFCLARFSFEVIKDFQPQ